MEMRPGLNDFMDYVKKTLKELNSERKCDSSGFFSNFN